MVKKQFVVIGLGRFGSSVARSLYSLGHDVLAVDMDEDRVAEVADEVTHAVQLDATDEPALRSLGISNFDVAVISIGSNLKASILIALLVKEMGVKQVVAKGNSELHAKVLDKIGVNKVILPEKDMGIRVGLNLGSSTIMDFIELSPDYNIMEIEAPKEWDGKSLKELNAREKYGINVMAIKNGDHITVSPLAQQIIKSGDILVVIASDSVTALEKRLKR